MKGIHDSEKSSRRILVTGSARLDYYRKRGDSLANRYRYFRLHPFSLPELGPSATRSDVDALLRFGGFPEPFLTQDEREHRIWQRDRISRVVREDLRELEHVREISLIEQLVDLLPLRVGSPLSVNNLREDLGVDHKTVDRWLTILDNLYVCFRIAPYGAPRVRAVKKERKLYLWDWSMAPEGGRVSRTSSRASSSSTATGSKTRKATRWSCAFCATQTSEKSISSFCAIESRSLQ